jgi:hypothetical protein
MGRNMPGLSPEAAMFRAVTEIIAATRKVLANGGVIEDVLDAVITGAKHEFNCTVTPVRPMILRIDGHDFQWPETKPNSRRP